MNEVKRIPYVAPPDNDFGVRMNGIAKKAQAEFQKAKQIACIENSEKLIAAILLAAEDYAKKGLFTLEYNVDGTISYDGKHLLRRLRDDYHLKTDQEGRTIIVRWENEVLGN